MNSPNSVFEEVKLIFGDMFGQEDSSLLAAVFDDVVSLFQGRYSGYEACDTPYHNLQHTTDVFLAMARFIHGAHIAGKKFSETDVTMGLIAALMHDTGYVLKDSDSLISGAQLAPIHVSRSVDFMTHCLTQNGFLKNQISQTAKIILCTEHEIASGIPSDLSKTHQLLGNMMAAADLLAQTADRTYLEKLPHLYREFRETGIGNYECELDLIRDSIIFNEQMHARLKSELDDVMSFLKNHFNARWNVNTNLYAVAIDRSMRYLESILLPDANHYRSHLRRALY